MIGPRKIVVDERDLRQLARAIVDREDPEVLRGILAPILRDAEESASPWLSIAAAADTLGVHRRTVERRLSDGTLPSRRLGGRVLIPMEYVRSRQEPTGADRSLPAAPPAGHGGSDAPTDELE